MTAPWPSFTFVDGALAVLALSMFGLNVYIITRLFPGREPQLHLGDVILITGLLLTGISLWLALDYAAISPTTGAWIAILLAINSMMVVAGAWFVGVMLRAEERRVSRTGWAWPLTFASLVLGNELSMAVAFVLVQTGPDPYFGPAGTGLVGLLADGATSVWFFWPMLGSMATIVLWVPMRRGERRALLGLTASAAVGPWVVAAPLVGAVAMSVLMGAVFGLLFREIGKEPSGEFLGVARGVVAGFAGMAAAEAAFFLAPTAGWAPVPYATANLVVMAAELVFLGRLALASSGPGPRVVPSAPTTTGSPATSPIAPSEPAGSG